MVIRDPFAQKDNSNELPQAMICNPLDRLAAHIADSILLLPLLSVVLAPLKSEFSESRFVEDRGAELAAFGKAGFIVFLVIFVWQVGFSYFFAATPGKLIFGLRIRSQQNNDRLDLWSLSLRSVSWMMSCLPMGLPFLGVFGNSQRRPLHDRLAETEVVALRKDGRFFAPDAVEISLSRLVSLIGLFILFLLTTATFSQIRGHQDENTEVVECVPEKTYDSSVSKFQKVFSAVAAGELKTSCLQGAADYEIWTGGEIATGYLAKAYLAYGNEPITLKKNLEQVCLQSPESTLCQLSKAAFVDDLEIRGPASTLSEESEIDEASLLRYIRQRLRSSHLQRNVLLGADYFALELVLDSEPKTTNRRLYEEALRLARLPPLSVGAGLKAIEIQVRLNWRLNNYQQSRILSQTYQSLQSPSMAASAKAWLCLQEFQLQPCSQQSHLACDFSGWAKDIAMILPNDNLPTFILGQGEQILCVGSQRAKVSLSKQISDLKSLASSEIQENYLDWIESTLKSDRDAAATLFNQIVNADQNSLAQQDLLIFDLMKSRKHKRKSVSQ